MTLGKLRGTDAGDLITVHLMPQNLCNQSCSFCSYRLPDNKNSSIFDDRAHIPWRHMCNLLCDFEAMGVKGIELTGGGEPLAYPHIEDLLINLGDMEVQVGLVTNGTLFHKIQHGFAGWLGDRLSWVRVSIDAASPSTYARMRKSTTRHFQKAWQTVIDIGNMRDSFHPDFRLGVSFVLSNENTEEVYDFVRLAKEMRADNVRLSATFSDQHEHYYTDWEGLDSAIVDSIKARVSFEDDDFKVYNLIHTRLREIENPHQDYRRCPTKDLLCVVEGSGKVYTCCTYTGSLQGLYGNFIKFPGGFRSLWESHGPTRADWDTHKRCKVSCLYRDRNVAMNKLIDGPPQEEVPEMIHREFI